MTYTINHLSASTDGKPIRLSGTDTAGAVLLHTAVAGADIDEVNLFANNTSGVPVDVTIEFGGTGASEKIIRTIPAKTTKMVVEGAVLQGGLLVKGFASTADVINVYGKVGSTT